MSALLGLVAGNALAAAVLALLAWTAGFVVKRPTLTHALWALALLRLLTPPLVPLEVLPRPMATAAPHSVGQPGTREQRPTPARIGAAPARSAHGDDAVPAVPEPRSTMLGSVAPATADLPVPLAQSSLDPSQLGGLLVLIGASGVLALGTLRNLRFGRLTATTRPAPEEMQSRAAALAARLGLRRAPPIRVVDAFLSPMVVAGWRGTRILWPAPLLTALSPSERDALLVHELAHVRRRDHWMRFVELAATALSWWSPVTWWTRRALRETEERCCDEWVLRVLPGSARAYASGLLKTVSLLSDGRRQAPALASSASPARNLEQRLREVLMHRPQPRLGAIARLALAVCAVLALGVFPTWVASAESGSSAAVQAAAAAPPPPPPATPVLAAAEEEDGLAAEGQALRAERLELRQRMHEIERRELELKRRRREAQTRRESRLLRERLETAEKRGDSEQVEQLQREVAAFDQRVELERERMQIEATEREARAQRELEIETRQLEVEKMEAAGHHAEAEAARRQLQEFHRALEQAELGRMESELQLREREMAVELELRRAQLEGEAAVRARDAERLSAELERQKREHTLETELRRGELDVHRAMLEARRLEQRAQTLEREGDGEDASQARAQAERARQRAEQMGRQLQAERREVEMSRVAEELERRLHQIEELRAAGRDEEASRLEMETAGLRSHLESLRRDGIR